MGADSIGDYIKNVGKLFCIITEQKDSLCCCYFAYKQRRAVEKKC